MFGILVGVSASRDLTYCVLKFEIVCALLAMECECVLWCSFKFDVLEKTLTSHMQLSASSLIETSKRNPSKGSFQSIHSKL